MWIGPGLNWQMIVERIERGGRRAARPDVAAHISDDPVDTRGGHGRRQRLGHHRNALVTFVRLASCSTWSGSSAKRAAAAGSRTSDITKSNNSLAMKHPPSLGRYMRR
jgi:hypothetical protein